MSCDTHGVRRYGHVDIVFILHGLITVLFLLMRGRPLDHAVILSCLGALGLHKGGVTRLLVQRLMGDQAETWLHFELVWRRWAIYYTTTTWLTYAYQVRLKGEYLEDLHLFWTFPRSLSVELRRPWTSQMTFVGILRREHWSFHERSFS